MNTTFPDFPAFPAAAGFASGTLTGAFVKQGARSLVLPVTLGSVVAYALHKKGYVSFDVDRVRDDATKLWQRLDLNGDGRVDVSDVTEAAKRIGVTGDVAAASTGFVTGFVFGFKYF